MDIALAKYRLVIIMVKFSISAIGTYLWPDLQNPFLHSHSNFQLDKTVTPPVIEPQFCNFVQCFSYYWSYMSINFESLAQPHAKLCLFKFQKLDANIRPFFPHPVTFFEIVMVPIFLPIFAQALMGWFFLMQCLVVTIFTVLIIILQFLLLLTMI